MKKKADEFKQMFKLDKNQYYSMLEIPQKIMRVKSKKKDGDIRSTIKNWDKIPPNIKKLLEKKMNHPSFAPAQTEPAQKMVAKQRDVKKRAK